MLENLVLFICERELSEEPIILEECDEDGEADTGHKYRTIILEDRELIGSEQTKKDGNSERK